MSETAPVSPSEFKNGRPICIFFNKPGFFIGFSSNTKGFQENSESMMSPTSILDSKSGIGTYFWPERRPKLPESVAESKNHRWVGPGLGLVDALDQGSNSEKGLLKPERKMVLFGSQLKIQIPPRRDSPAFRAPLSAPCRSICESPVVFTGRLTPREMELSEDYTRVIARGSNPRTTHIYGDRIVESCAVEYPDSGKDLSLFSGSAENFPSGNFLRFCYACKKQLGDNDDIFMYRGYKGFCSSECRYQEIIFDEENRKLTSHSSASQAPAHCRKIFEAGC